jgi:anti-anti-sigma factor
MTPPADRPPAAARIRARSTETVVHASGEFDLATLPLLEEALSRAHAHGRDVLVDLSQVTFVDATSLGAIVQAHGALAVEARVLRLVNVPARIDKLLGVTRLRTLLAA